MATNFEPHEHVILVRSMKIGTHENKAIHSTVYSVYSGRAWDQHKWPDFTRSGIQKVVPFIPK